MLRYFFLSLIVLYLQSVSAEDRIVSSSYYVDQSASLSFSEAREQAFQEYSGLLSLGFTGAAVWLHLELDVDGTYSDEEFVARIRPSYLDEVSLFYETQSEIAQSVTGYRYPVSNDRYPALYFNLGIPVSERPEEIWIRLETSSTSLIHVEVLELQEAISQDRRHELVFALYLSALTLFVIWGAVHWFGSRDKVMLAFVFKQVVSLAYALAYLGYVRLFWPDSFTLISADQFLTFAILVVVPAVIQFDYSFIKGFGPARKYLLLLKALMLMGPFLLLMAALGMEGTALSWNNMVIAAAPIVSFLAVLSIPADRSPEAAGRLVPKRYLVALYFFILVSLSFSTMAALGFLHAVEWSLNGFLLHPFWTGLAIIAVLQIRASRSEKEKLGLQLALQSAEQRVVMEEAKSKEQGRFLAMLIHELKTPLSVVRMVMGAKRKSLGMQEKATRSLEEMNSVLERCLQSDMLDSALIKPEVSVCSPADEVRELAAHYSDDERLRPEIRTEQEINSDVILLRRIIINLIDNALKYGDKDSTVDIVVSAETQDGVDGVAISVANPPGRTGWPDETKLFNKYYRAPGSHTVTGSGLGLFLVQGLAELIHGHLQYQPSDTLIIFKLWIPRSI